METIPPYITLACKTGYHSALTAFACIVTFCIVQLLQLARVFYYPMDEILIYASSLCIVVPFLFAMVSFHYTTAPGKQLWSHAALIFAVLYAVFVTANYVVQLATVIPMRLKGKADAIAILQQAPHSMFWNFDAVGYIFMGISLITAVPAFERHSAYKWVRISFLAHGLATSLTAIVYFYPEYSENVLMLGLPWAVTAPLSMLLLAQMFRNKLQRGS